MNKVMKNAIDNLAKSIAKLILALDIPVNYILEKIRFWVIRDLHENRSNSVDIAARTGIDRRVVRKYIDQNVDESFLLRRVDHVFLKFAEHLRANGLKRLPYKSESGFSFETICKEQGKHTVTVRATLNELIRMGLVSEDGSHVVINDLTGNEIRPLVLKSHGLEDVVFEIEQLTMKLSTE